MARQMTVPELQREVSLHGRRPSWNLQAAQAPSSTKPPAGAAAAPDAASPQVCSLPGYWCSGGGETGERCST